LYPEAEDAVRPERSQMGADDLFSPTIPFPIAKLPAVQKLLGAGAAAGDREVDLTITSLTPVILNQELVVTATLA
jgi:hypothetical protein